MITTSENLVCISLEGISKCKSLPHCYIPWTVSICIAMVYAPSEIHRCFCVRNCASTFTVIEVYQSCFWWGKESKGLYIKMYEFDKHSFDLNLKNTQLDLNFSKILPFLTTKTTMHSMRGWGCCSDRYGWSLMKSIFVVLTIVDDFFTSLSNVFKSGSPTVHHVTRNQGFGCCVCYMNGNELENRSITDFICELDALHWRI